MSEQDDCGEAELFDASWVEQLLHLTDTQKELAQLQGYPIPALPVSAKDEYELFDYFVVDGNFEGIWNRCVAGLRGPQRAAIHTVHAATTLWITMHLPRHGTRRSSGA